MKKKTINNLRRKYSTVKIFIFTIVFLIVVCFLGALYFYSCRYDFVYSALLNVFGGLLTGFILLLYQYLSNKQLEEANIVVEKLKHLDEIQVFYASELDFCTEYSNPLDEQMEEDRRGTDEILKDDQGIAYALDIYKKEIRKAEKQLKVIRDFSNDILRMPLDYFTYENKLTQTKQFFSTYSEEVGYEMPPYLLYKRSQLDKDLIETFATKDVMNAYLENNPEILNSSLYYIDPPEHQYEVRVVYKNKTQVLIKDIYKDWIQKMNHLAESTQDFNESFLEIKEKIIGFHSKNSNIIH